jgi:4-coumarate--CoA ligase
VLEPGDAVIGYPDFWRAVVRAAPRLPAGVTGVTSTAPSEPEIAANLRAQGLARFIDVYGSSETAGIGWRDDESAPYRLFAPWQRGAGERELQRVLRGGGMRPAVVPDRLVWDDDRHVRPVGRDENGVQVGGVNVFPERVAAVLGAHPDVAQAAVRLMRPDEGRRLKAFVVPREPGADPGALVARLWPWLEERLSAPECPKSIVVGSELPAGVFGKAADWPIPDAAPGVGFPEGHRSL